MKVVWEQELFNFPAWSGGRDTLHELKYHECIDLEQYIEELYPDGIEAGELNDFLWYERDSIAEYLGFKDFDEIIERNKELID